jgi:hypothetical protein
MSFDSMRGRFFALCASAALLNGCGERPAATAADHADPWRQVTIEPRLVSAKSPILEDEAYILFGLSNQSAQSVALELDRLLDPHHIALRTAEGELIAGLSPFPLAAGAAKPEPISVTLPPGAEFRIAAPFPRSLLLNQPDGIYSLVSQGFRMEPSRFKATTKERGQPVVLEAVDDPK